MRKHLAAALFALFLTPAFGQVPPPVPALPDAPRLTTYSISGTTCACNIGYALYGDGTDYYSWVEVYLNGVRVNYNDATYGWTVTSPSGSLGSLPRPITNAVLTFTNTQTGTVQIVGARRPRRLSQFTENRGVAARDLNQALTDIIAENRETWDKVNDVTGRALISQPGNTVGLLPLPSLCAGGWLGFDATGLIPVCRQGGVGSGNITGPGASTNGHIPLWNNSTGSLLSDSGYSFAAPPAWGTTTPNVVDASVFNLGTLTQYTGALATVDGSFYSAQTDPTMVVATPTFDAATNGGAQFNVITTYSASIPDTSFRAQAVINSGTTAGGAGGGVYGGVLIQDAGHDPFGVLGVVRNVIGSTLVTPYGAAMWALIRGDVATGGGASSVDAFRITTENTDNQHARAGIYIYSSTALNAPDKGIIIANSMTSGLEMGGAGLVIPTNFEAFYNTGGSKVFGVSGTGVITGTGTSITGLPISTGLTGTGTGVLTALAVNTGTAGAFQVNNQSISLNNLTFSTTAPTISSGCGTGSPSISAPNGTAAFRITIGTGSGNTCVLAMPTAATAWNCVAFHAVGANIGTANASVIQTANTTSQVTLTNYSDIAGAATWVTGDIIGVNCTGF